MSYLQQNHFMEFDPWSTIPIKKWNEMDLKWEVTWLRESNKKRAQPCNKTRRPAPPGLLLWVHQPETILQCSPYDTDSLPSSDGCCGTKAFPRGKRFRRREQICRTTISIQSLETFEVCLASLTSFLALTNVQPGILYSPWFCPNIW